MTARYVRHVIAAGLLVGGAVAFTVERGQAQAPEASVLPAEGGAITLVGCFTRGGHHNKYVLAKPMANVTSVTEATCATSDADQMIELKDTGKSHLRKTMMGRWVEITGRLEPIASSAAASATTTTTADVAVADLRELHVKSFRFPPVVIPRAAEVLPPPERPQAFTPAPAPEAPAPAPEKPVATTGTAPAPAPLPKTASPLPLIGSLGLLSLAGGLGVHLFARRRVGHD